MKILYVPHWLTVGLRGAHAPKSLYTNISGLLDIVSSEDVGFYIYLNQHLSDILPPGLTDTFDSYGGSFSDQLIKRSSESMNDIMRSWNDYEHGARSRPHETENRLLTCDLGDEHTIVFTHVHPTPEVIRAIGHDPLLWLYGRLIRLYKPFVSFEGLASTPLFLQYLRAMGRQMGQPTQPHEDDLIPKAPESTAIA